MINIEEKVLVQLNSAIKQVEPFILETEEDKIIEEYIEKIKIECPTQLSAINDYIDLGFLTDEKRDEIILKRVTEVVEVAEDMTAVRDNGYSWYSNVKNGSWEYYKKYLSKKGFKSEDIDEIDKTTSNILCSVENPLISKKFSQKGLVIGNIQSGKTANFTGLISKFIDSKVDYIVVFTGIHNTLRNQTQKRIENDLIGRTLSTEGTYETVGIGKEFPGYESNAKMITNTYEDIKSSDNRDLEAEGNDKTKIFIVKKNVSTLNNLKKIFASVEDTNKSILVIDDEADNASIDTNSNNENKDETATNSSIRTLLQMFDRSFYIAYTATPYANIFIDKDTKSDKLDEDLFPKDFIIKLKASKAYTGYDKYFKTAYKDHLVVRIDDTIEDDKFEDAVIDFMIGAALKKYLYEDKNEFANFKDKHATMLIHTSHLKNDHHTQEQTTRELFDEYSSLIMFHDDENLKSRMHLSFANSRSAYQKINGELLNVSFESVLDKLKDMLNKEEFNIVVNNSDTDNVLDYDDEFRTYIVIGGNTLSRGLTLEGLIVSYFGRTSNTMDTMSQMARWFGYRANYLFLTKVYISEIGIEYFNNIAIVDELIDEQLREMHQFNESPREFSIMISKFGSLNPTSRNKLGAATQKAFSFSEDGPQITGVDINNFEKNKDFIDKFMCSFDIEKSNDGYKVSNLVSKDVIAFLKQYREINSDDRLYSVRTEINSWVDYINEKNELKNPELVNWTVVLKGKKEIENTEQFSFGELNFVNRATTVIPNAPETLRRSKVISAPQDEYLDLDVNGVNNDRKNARKLRSEKNGLVIIYAVHARDIDFGENAFTLAMSFPKSKVDTGIEIQGFIN